MMHRKHPEGCSSSMYRAQDCQSQEPMSICWSLGNFVHSLLPQFIPLYTWVSWPVMRFKAWNYKNGQFLCNHCTVAEWFQLKQCLYKMYAGGRSSEPRMWRGMVYTEHCFSLVYVNIHRVNCNSSLWTNKAICDLLFLFLTCAVCGCVLGIIRYRFLFLLDISLFRLWKDHKLGRV